MNRALFMSKIHASMYLGYTSDVEIAYLLAKKIHKGQVRKELGPDGQPLRYFEHLRRTALIILDEAGLADPEMIEAALLHDAIEDADEVQLVSSLIEKLFGFNVANAVRAVTKVPKAGYIDRLTMAIEGSYALPAIIKAADRLDNLRSLPEDNPAFCERQRVETRDVFLPLFAKAEKYLRPEWKTGFQRIVGQIRERV